MNGFSYTCFIMPNFNGYINSKLPETGTSIFTKMSALANTHNAINLSQGFPQDNPPPKLIELVNSNMKAGFNQYAPMAGHQKLRNNLAKKVKQLYNADYNAETEITITAGGTQAINTAILALINTDDEVIILQPAYDSYAPSVKLAGGIPVFFNLNFPDFSIDWDLMKKKINAKTKMIIINNPHNPTGTILKKEDLETLQHLLEGSNILVLADEVYEHLVFDKTQHQSVLLFDDLKRRSIIVYSFGKAYNCTGWKIGYCFAPQQLMKEIRKAHQFQIFSVNKPKQMALADFLDNKDYLKALVTDLQAKRDLFRAGLQNSKFELLPCQSTYFQLARYKEISNKNDVEFCEELTIKHKVAAIPVSAFYNDKTDDKLVRFCFAKSNDILKQATDILCNI